MGSFQMQDCKHLLAVLIAKQVQFRILGWKSRQCLVWSGSKSIVCEMRSCSSFLLLIDAKIEQMERRGGGLVCHTETVECGVEYQKKEKK